ncbi:MAG: 2,5-diketo-D-gluconate reductase [Actinomycetota bacterium]|jgi:diketogulonate reductase-like aldo/keto reductase|nr:2,5-diketo-D-gluconate reductase [Actinomycetota bacterium]MDQ1560824.1 2,5-diketo-D-gluconate reductase [Actinomycetota bacterium]MDQ1564585.1 2,5-diketo-D-gluconate reductase [Actinomycetota bacterium]MDQ1573905.1 2,5-diketo-D-gluconate reductase [Actinomycetota bacterium]
MAIPSLPLNDGNELPAIGLGTYGLRGDAGTASIVSALDAGYRLLDTALNYQNEREVGDAVRASDVPRSDIVVTSKLPGRFHGYDETLAGFEETRTNLGLEYVDLYLIHWPLPRVNKYIDSWRAMIRLQEEGAIRSIGVSNFTQENITRLLAETGVVPAVNQIELHPRFPQRVMRQFDAGHSIVTESWSPLGDRDSLLAEPVIGEIAAAHSVTPTQAVLRWHIQLGTLPIPKSGNPERQRENIDVFGFELTDAEVASISALESDRLWDGNPDTHEEF